MTLNRAKYSLIKRDANLKRLTKLLAAERRLNDALSNLAFLPVQKAAHLKELKKATTMRRKLLEG